MVTYEYTWSEQYELQRKAERVARFTDVVYSLASNEEPDLESLQWVLLEIATEAKDLQDIISRAKCNKPEVRE